MNLSLRSVAGIARTASAALQRHRRAFHASSFYGSSSSPLSQPSSTSSTSASTSTSASSASSTSKSTEQLRARFKAPLEAATRHCIDMLHKGDFDNQLVGLSMPREISPLYYSLRAFNSEIANVKDSCRGNIAAGDMRLRWWEDILSCIDNPNHEFSSFKHPVADALYLSCKSLGLSSAMLYRSLDCRRKNLNVTRPKSLDELEDYAERAYSSLNYMLIEALGIKDDEVDMMASHFGVSSGLCLLIMSIPFHSNELYIPEETAQKFNLTMSIARGTFTNQEDKKKFCDALFDLSSQSYGHLSKGIELFNKKKSQYPKLNVLASTAVPSVVYLEQFRIHDFNIYAMNMQDPRIKFAIQWKLTKLKLFNKL